MNQKPRISAVVCTKNRADLLQGCLETACKQDIAENEYEIIVIDDGSTDHTKQVVETAANRKQDGLHYFYQVNAGQNAARNHGIRRSKGEIIYFFDDDERLQEDHFSRISKRFAEYPEAGGVGGPYRDFGGTSFRTCGRCESLSAVDLPGTGVRPVPRLLGGNMAIRKHLFEEHGYFDPEINGRGDEVEWFYRMRGKSTWIFDPDMWVLHRRDSFTLTTLWKHAYRQGLSMPASKAKRGKPYNPGLLKVLRFLTHALRFRCAKGFVLAAREYGAYKAQKKIEIARAQTTG